MKTFNTDLGSQGEKKEGGGGETDNMVNQKWEKGAARESGMMSVKGQRPAKGGRKNTKGVSF